MEKYYLYNDGAYVPEPFVRFNKFINRLRENEALPTFGACKNKIPEPFWEGHQSAIDCYYKAWELGFDNLRQPTVQNQFITNYIDTAFNGCLYMWDSCFILFFGKYARDSFDFLKTLDNFYAKQHEDGFICRQLNEKDGRDSFEKFNPASTGPNILAWVEWEYYQSFGSTERLSEVFPVLFAYHRWLKLFRTWRDGSYWSSGLGCGMDNQPRMNSNYPDSDVIHGNQVWADATLQQIFNAKILLKMLRVLKADKEIDFQRRLSLKPLEVDVKVPYKEILTHDRMLTVSEIEKTLIDDAEHLENYVNKKLWDTETNFYYDLWEDDALSPTMTVGAYWALLAECVPNNRKKQFVAHLENPNEFKRLHSAASLSAGDKAFDGSGDYWCGSVWPPTNYMVIRGLEENGFYDRAFDIAYNHLENVVKVFEKTGTLWENYAPDKISPGNPAKKDFVGWSGLAPISVMFESVYGIRANAVENMIEWRVNLLDRHGIQNYPFGKSGSIDLCCEKRKTADQKPEITVKSNVDFILKIVYNGTTELIKVKAMKE